MNEINTLPVYIENKKRLTKENLQVNKEKKNRKKGDKLIKGNK